MSLYSLPQAEYADTSSSGNPSRGCNGKDQGCSRPRGYDTSLICDCLVVVMSRKQ